MDNDTPTPTAETKRALLLEAIGKTGDRIARIKAAMTDRTEEPIENIEHLLAVETAILGALTDTYARS